MKIKYKVIFKGEIEVDNDTLDDQIPEIIEEYVYDTNSSEIEWEVINK